MPNLLTRVTATGVAVARPGTLHTGTADASGAVLTVSGATNASPIVVTTSAAHLLSTGQTVVVASVGGNTAANGTFTITVLTSTTFSLDGSTGNGAYTSGGTVTTTALMTDAASSFGTSSELVGAFVEITAGTGAGQIRTIAAHDATRLSVTPAWSTTPGATSVFRVYRNLAPLYLHGLVITTAAAAGTLVFEDTLAGSGTAKLSFKLAATQTSLVWQPRQPILIDNSVYLTLGGTGVEVTVEHGPEAA